MLVPGRTPVPRIVHQEPRVPGRGRSVVGRIPRRFCEAYPWRGLHLVPPLGLSLLKGCERASSHETALLLFCNLRHLQPVDPTVMQDDGEGDERDEEKPGEAPQERLEDQLVVVSRGRGR